MGALEKLGIPEELIGIVRSFHENMKARIRVDGELLEEIENGLRKGCTMSPSLFNLYACVVAERWLDRVSDVEGVGKYLLYKYDQKLFRRNTRGASNSTLLPLMQRPKKQSKCILHLWQVGLA